MTIATPDDLREAADLLEAAERIAAKFETLTVPDAPYPVEVTEPHFLLGQFTLPAEPTATGGPAGCHAPFDAHADALARAKGNAYRVIDALNDADALSQGIDPDAGAVAESANGCAESVAPEVDPNQAMKDDWITHGHAQRVVDDYYDHIEACGGCGTESAEHVAITTAWLEVASELDFNREETAIFLTYLMREADALSHEKGLAQGISDTLDAAMEAAAAFPGTGKKSQEAVAKFPLALARGVLGSREAGDDWLHSYALDKLQVAATELGATVVLND